MTTPTPEALARQIVGDWEGQLTIPVSQMAKLDLEQRIYAALTEQAREIERLKADFETIVSCCYWVTSSSHWRVDREKSQIFTDVIERRARAAAQETP